MKVLQLKITNNTNLANYFWVLSFLKPYLRPLAGFIVCSLLLICVELSIPKFIQYFIDVIFPEKRLSAFVQMLGVIALLVILMIAATVYKNRLQRVIQEKAARDMQISMFDHLRSLGFAYYEKNSSGATLSLFNTEVSSIQQIYQRYFPNMIILSITLTVSAFLMLSIHTLLTLIMIPCFLSYYLIGPYFEKRAARLGKETGQARKDFHQKVYDFVSSLLELRMSQSEAWDQNRIITRQKTVQDLTMKLHFMAYSRGLVRRVLVSFGAVAVFAYGAYLIQNEAITPGALVAFMFYYFRMMQDLTFFVTLSSEQSVLLHQAGKLFDYMKEKPEVTEDPHPLSIDHVRGEISFKEVYFHYPTLPDIIRGVSLDIRAGEKVALVGTSGNGKSTLLKMIGRFYDPYQGEITLDGVSLRKLSLKQIRESMGFVFQESYLFGTTVRDNIRFGSPNATDSRIEEAAMAAYAHDFIQQLPKGYETIVGERGVKLSGGQKQRIAIARMFIKNPKIVLLDEATSSLDNISEREVQAALKRLFEHRTTIAIAHRLSTVKDFDRILVVEDGSIVEEGTYEELMNMDGVFHRLAEGKDEVVS